MIKSGEVFQSYEYDSKSGMNSYYAFINRHNSNVLKPDLSMVANLKAFCRGYFDSLVRNFDREINFIDPVSWL